MKSLFLCLIAASSLYSGLLIKGSGRIDTDIRKLEDFNQVTINVPGDIFLQQGTTSSVIIEGDDNVISNIETENTHGSVTIRTKPGLYFSTKLPLTYKIITPNLNFLQINGVGSLTTDGALSSDQFELFINGSGDAELNLTTQDLKIQIIGAGSCKIMGSTISEKITIQGSGECDAFDVKAIDGKIDISGSGSVLTNCSKTLDIKIRGTGRVQYGGSPKLTQSISGMGTIDQIEAKKP
jgi:hypothetical protein